MRLIIADTGPNRSADDISVSEVEGVEFSRSFQTGVRNAIRSFWEGGG